MIFRISLILFVSSFFFSFHDCLSDTAVGADQFVDDSLVVQLPETEKKFDNDESNRYEKPAERKTHRIKRSSWSLPKNTTTRFLMDWIIPVRPLNNTSSYIVIDLSYLFVLPTYTQLYNLYGTLGRMDEESEEESEEENIWENNMLDYYYFFEEQRANKERRSVYEHAEILFERYVYKSYRICDFTKYFTNTFKDLVMTDSLVCCGQYANWPKLQWPITD